MVIILVDHITWYWGSTELTNGMENNLTSLFNKIEIHITFGDFNDT